jgi:stage IV sporulation protein FB
MRTDIPTIRNRGSLDEALRVMQDRRLPAVAVVDGAGALVGLVTPENVGEMIMVQAAARSGPGGGAWRSRPSVAGGGPAAPRPWG